MANANNPLSTTHSTAPPPVSETTYTIAGILTTIYGLSELPSNPKILSCLWLLHPRLQTQSCMASLASTTIDAWNSHPSSKSSGLIAISFDQRNHGSRQVTPLANEAWRSGNPTHAQDMFSIYHGTSLDLSHLLPYLPAYLPLYLPHPTNHLVLGVSLGGHSAWHSLLHSHVISTGIIIVGCPDYTTLMTSRASLSKLPSYISTNPPGASFIGSQDFPPALVNEVKKWDPAGCLMGNGRERLKCLRGKRILNLAGKADKLVPYACGAQFLTWLKGVIGPGGDFEDGGVMLEDMIFEGVGHEMSPGMLTEAVRFVIKSLEETCTITSHGTPNM